MSGQLQHTRIAVTTAGGDGVATGNTDSDHPISGEILGLFVQFASMPATTDVTIKTKGPTPPSMNILVGTNINTDEYLAFRRTVVDEVKGAITNAHAPMCITDYINVGVAQADAGTDAVVVWVFYRD